jgi:hypothetical protein
MPILLQPGERSPFDTSVAAGLVGLVYVAKQAFEEKRRKQCLEMINAILKIEPQHPEALTIQASVRADLEKEFATACLLAREAQTTRDATLSGQAAAVLRRIVDADPENFEAQTLLHETVAGSHLGAPNDARAFNARGRRRKIVVGSVALVVLVVVLALPKGTGSQVATTPQAKPVPPVVAQPQVAPAIPADLPPLPLPTDTAPIRLVAVRPPDAAPAIAAPLRNASTAPVALGDLAISAAVPVDIYRGEEHLGSTPITLQLPAGLQTLEYRYQGLRQTLTHTVTAQETTTATVQFLTKVQINARPWAQVFVAGARLTPIGQTPLGDVSVPIGGVLVFQNPGFPEKRYRVTAKDAAIQMTFP